MNRLLTGVAVGLGLLLPAQSWAWWDTVAEIVRPVPLIKEIEAEQARSLAPARIIDDAQSNGGAGGKAVVLNPGGDPVTFDLNLKPGLYMINGIMRSPEQPTALGLVTLTLTEHASKQTRSWTMPFTCRDTYFSALMLYFPAHQGGDYTLEFRLESDPAKGNLDKVGYNNRIDEAGKKFIERWQKQPAKIYWLDRLELRDCLGHLGPIQQTKSRRMLTSDAQIAEIRRAFQENPAINLPSSGERFNAKNPPLWFTTPRSPQQRQIRNDELWSRVPDFNAPVSHGPNPWHFIIGHDRRGMILEAGDAYEQTGHLELAWDGAVLLAATAEKYPALDYLAQGLTGHMGGTGPVFGISAWPGKNVYRGWAGSGAIQLIHAYDKLFDFIKDNQPLADYVGRKIPGIRTPQDLVQFLDTRLLRHIHDGAMRGQIEGSDTPKILPALVLGPGPESDLMLRNGIFLRIAKNMTHRGGIDDHAFSSYSRDGVHHIGSAGYLSDDLTDISELLAMYVQAGGNPVFDLSDPLRFPNVVEGRRTLEQIRIGKGFRLLQGDAGDLRNGREPVYLDKIHPSRVLGGYGMSILETGQFQANPLLARGLGMYFGIGRGHSQQDTLNLEIVAHGTRVAPDLGGRHEGKNSGSPNMRSNRVHNLVEVDDRNFQNQIGGSTTSGTGWNTSFAPHTGVQFMEHHARASSHPQVTRYARQTAMIDVPLIGATGDEAMINSGNSYIFDVFRVAGGKLHTYCFHGAPTQSLSMNTTLSEELTPEDAEYLRRHFPSSQRVGASPPEMLQVDWAMREDLQKSYQGAQFQADRPVTTRLSLFGNAGRRVLVGNAFSEQYKYNFPFLYVRGSSSDEGKQSVYPALIEPFAGQPFLTEKEQLSISPQQYGVDGAVALRVKTTGGTTDVLYASNRPGEMVTIADQGQADGKFAFVSTDAAGLRAAQLVGGTTLRTADVQITVPTRAHEAPITSVNYPQRTLRVASKLPVQLLAGQWLGMTNPGGLVHTFEVESARRDGDGTLITHRKSARYYLSTILNRDASRGTVETEIEPPLFGADPNFITGTWVGNEKGDRLSRVSIEESDRWMHIGWPGYRTSYPNTISINDLPDTNSDGKRTLKLIGKNKEDQDETLLNLEVTRVNDDGLTFYFKLPENEEYQRGGWQYNGKLLVNEDGSKTWSAVFPGSSYLWILDPAAHLKVSDFTDADGDGRAKLSAYLYGPGDRIALDTAVHLRRISDKLYRVNSNSPCTVAIKAAGASGAEVSSDGKTFRPVTSSVKDGRLMLQLSEQDLGSGSIWVRLTP